MALYIHQLPFLSAQGEYKKLILRDHLVLNNRVIPKGTQIKIRMARNGCFVFLPKACKDILGVRVSNHIFKSAIR